MLHYLTGVDHTTIGPYTQNTDTDDLIKTSARTDVVTANSPVTVKDITESVTVNDDVSTLGNHDYNLNGFTNQGVVSMQNQFSK